MEATTRWAPLQHLPQGLGEFLEKKVFDLDKIDIKILADLLYV